MDQFTHELYDGVRSMKALRERFRTFVESDSVWKILEQMHEYKQNGDKLVNNLSTSLRALK
jgi:hypothetical protein